MQILWDGSIALVIDKPAGVAVQAPSKYDSVERRLRAELGADCSYVAFPHRLDRPVSGVLLVALRKRAARLLSDQFASQKVRKHYLAEVAGEFPRDRDLWRDWTRKVDQIARVEIAAADAPGSKLAETEVQRLRYCEATDTTFLRLVPRTGRMHQLRIQSAVRGHPIVGDSLYRDGSEPGESPSRTLEPGAPIHLHAESIRFHDPRDGTLVTVESKGGFRS